MPKTSKPRKATRAAAASLITEREKQFIHLAIKMGEEKAASAMNLSKEEIAGVMKTKAVREYLKQYNFHFLREMARYELNQVTKLPVGRADVLARLLSLALTPPEETRGTIDGQVAALASISKILGLDLTPRDADAYFRDKSPEQLRNYALYGKFDLTEEEKKPDGDPPAGQ